MLRLIGKDGGGTLLRNVDRLQPEFTTTNERKCNFLLTVVQRNVVMAWWLAPPLRNREIPGSRPNQPANYTVSPYGRITFNAMWSLYVPHSGYYTYHQFNIQQFYVLPTQFMCFVWI